MATSQVKRAVRALAVAAVLAGMFPSQTFCQETAPATTVEAPSEAKIAQMWDDFIHGIKVARAELVISNGQALLASASPRDLYLLSVKEDNLDAVLTRGARDIKDASPIIADIRKKIEEGFKGYRSDYTQIANAIDMLPKSLRAYEIAAERLIQSGEYAVPQLVGKLSNPATPLSKSERIITLLPRLGKDAVRPLSEALATNDSRLQEIVAGALGKIRYGEACPALKELLERKGILDRTRDVATAALIACGGREAVDKPISSQLYELAEKYYYQRESVAPDPNYATANVWYWKEGIGLEYKAVPREIFGDIYAMRLARKALKYDPAFYPAVSLWLAAKIKKEIDLPAGATDLTTVPGEPSAQFYALAGSAKYMQDVLNRALKDGNPALALRAIEALSKTAGAQSLVEPVAGGVQPLVAAMSNHDREVRMLAALTLAGALPQKHFDGDDMVMFVINEALRLVGKKQALLVAADQSQRNMLKDALRTAKYEVIEQADADKAIAAAREVNGLDMIVLGELPSVTSTVERLRSDPVCVAAPIVIASSDERAQRLAKAEGHIVLISDKAKSSEAAEAIAQAEKMGQAGALPAEKSAEWAIRAADAIAMLGTTANPVFDISKALGGLCEALGDPRGEVRVAAARALASMPSPQAQAALADMAINPSELAANISLDEKSRIDFFKVLVESLRRFGNKLTEKQAQAVVQIVTNDKEPMPLRLAAAEVMGAMNLPSDKIKSLIVDSPMAE